MLTKNNSKNIYNANQIKKVPKQSNKEIINSIKKKKNESLEISNNYMPINYNQNEQNYIDNNNKIKRNLNYFYADNNITNNKRKVKRTTPDIIYNRKPQNSPIKNNKQLNYIKYPLYHQNNSFNNIKYIEDNNNNNRIIMKNKNNEQYNNSRPSFILSKNKSYIISPQNELNIEIIQQKNAINNNNYYNIKFNKINNTENNYYKGKLIDYNQYRDNRYHKIEMGNNTYERSKSPQTSNIINDNRLNDDDSNYNKTSTNFHIPRQMKQSYNYERKKENRNNNANINKYNNHKEIEIIYSNNENQYNLNKNNYPNKSFIQDIDNMEKYNNYNNINDYNNYNNYNNSPDLIKKLTESKIRDDKISCLNNSVDNNLPYDLQQLENNKKSKGCLKKNRSVFIDNDISSQIRDNNFNQKNNDIKEIRHNKISYKNISSREQSVNNNKNKVINYNNENKNKEKLPKSNILFKKKPIKESSNINKDLNKSKIMQNKEFEICKNNSFNYENINDNRIIFDNEDNIVEYINKKYEEDKKKTYFNRKIKFTGFVLTKKYKGKNLYDIRIEDDIDKINQRLKEENVEVNNELIEIIPLNKNNNNINNNNNEDNKNKDIINNLEYEISKYKEKNESLTKKDILKNQLIKKLDYEKQNLIEENKKLSNEIEKIKKLNLTLNEEYQKLKNKNNVYTDFTIYKIENAISIDIQNKIKNTKKFDDIRLKEETMDISNINNNKNNESTINNNIFNRDNNKVVKNNNANSNDNKNSK